MTNQQKEKQTKQMKSLLNKKLNELEKALNKARNDMEMFKAIQAGYAIIEEVEAQWIIYYSEIVDTQEDEEDKILNDVSVQVEKLTKLKGTLMAEMEKLLPTANRILQAMKNSHQIDKETPPFELPKIEKPA